MNIITKYPNSLTVWCEEIRAVTSSSYIDDPLKAIIPLSYSPAMLALVNAEPVLGRPFVFDDLFHVLFSCEETLFQYVSVIGPDPFHLLAIFSIW